VAKKEKCEDCPASEAWIVSWADMMSLLLVFFMVLYAMANTDLKNFATVAASLRQAFNNVGVNPTSALIGNNGATSSQAMSVAPIFPKMLPPRQRDFVQVSAEMAVLAKQLDVGGEIDVNMTLEGLIISLSNELAFKSGSAELRPEAFPVLDKVAEFLQNSDNTIRVEGNTDDIPPNDPLYPTNWDLSVARAVSIVRYLAEDGGIAPNRLTAAGNAEFNPVVPNTNRNNRRRNRRADLVIVYPSGTKRFSISIPGVNLPAIPGSETATPQPDTAPTEQPVQPDNGQ